MRHAPKSGGVSPLAAPSRDKASVHDPLAESVIGGGRHWDLEAPRYTAQFLQCTASEQSCLSGFGLTVVGTCPTKTSITISVLKYHTGSLAISSGGSGGGRALQFQEALYALCQLRVHLVRNEHNVREY